MLRLLKPVTLFIIGMIIFSCVPGPRAETIVYYGSLGNVSTATFPVPSVSIPIGKWVPRGVREGLVVPCPGLASYPANDDEDHTNEIPICGIDVALADGHVIRHLEEMAVLVERWGFAAGITAINNRPGLTATMTNGHSAEAPHVFIMEIHAGYTAAIKVGTNVSLVFDDNNPYYVLRESGFAWYINVVYSTICIIFVIWGTYSIYHWGAFFHWKSHPILFSLLAETVANTLRFLNSINILDTRMLWTYEFTRFLFTAHLPLTLISSYLMSASIHDILRRSRGIKKTAMGDFLPTTRIPFFAVSGAILLVEVVLQVLTFVLPSPPQVLQFIIIGFYSIADIFIAVYFIRCNRQIVKAMASMAIDAAAKRIRIFNYQLMGSSVGHFGWFVMLVAVLSISFTIKDTLVFVFAQMAISHTGFMFVALMSGTTLVAIGLPMAGAGTPSSETNLRNASSHPSKSNKSSSTEKTLVLSDEDTSNV